MSEQRYNIMHMAVDKKRQSYSQWFNSPISITSGYMRSGGGYITHGNFIVDFYNQLQDIIMKHGHIIADEKEFKKEIARFIYSLSAESDYDGYESDDY